IDGAHWDLEIGCLTELMAEQNGPLLLFDNIPGYRKGFRIATNVLATPRRFALALGLPTELPKLEILRAWREKLRGLKPFPPTEVPSGPVSENIFERERVDLENFPAPKWHEHDGGRYIGTGDMVITRDPDSGWINVGTYRACVVDKNRVTLWIIEHKHGRQIATKYWKRNRACPVAVVLGCEPATWLAAPSAAKIGVSEYDYAGALRGAPVEVLRLPSSGLPVPATSEIILEGEIPPPEEESEREGPFGEWPGYYTHSGRETVVRVQRIMHRNDPILLGNPPLLPITERYGIPLFAARIWDHLEHSGVSDVEGIWCHCHTLMVVVALHQRYPGHAMHALTAVAGLNTGASMYRYFVAVDDDIDPADLKQVIWAMCTRVDPVESIQTLKSWSSDLDPRLPPERRDRGDFTMSRMLIDACKPFTWRDRFPLSNKFSAEKRKEIAEKWSRHLVQLSRLE
ncbi:MAG TPA: UbiD family decarboxylase, partial [Candidatus Udaeobacter sp.]|nr:UbiD family decarboxylase [Candidatus Udaeobacter sp.]